MPCILMYHVVVTGGCQSEKSPFSARYEDGKLYYEGEWYAITFLLFPLRDSFSQQHAFIEACHVTCQSKNDK